MTTEKKYRWALTGFIVMLLLNLATLATIWIERPVRSDWNRQTNDNQRRSGVHKFMQKELGLSQDQTETMATLRKSHFGEMRQLRDELDAQRRAYFEFIMGTDSDNQQKRDSILTELKEQYIETENAFYLHMKEMKSVLTADQQQKFKQLMRETMARDRRENGMGMRRHR